MQPACTVGLRWVQTARQHMNEMRAVPSWHSSVSECGGCLCSHPTVVWAFWIHDLNKEETCGPMDGSNTVHVGTASGVAKARTIKRLPRGDRWTGSLLDEARGSELTPDTLEDDGGGVGIRPHVLQPHVAVPLPPLVPEFRQVRRAPLHRTDFEQFGHTDNCPGCANARAGRKQAVDHSEQCRSCMEAILVTTTEGHMRLERARERFAQFAEEPGVMESSRKRRRSEGEGGQTRAISIGCAKQLPGRKQQYQRLGVATGATACATTTCTSATCKTEFRKGDRNDRCDRGTTGRIIEAQGASRSASSCRQQLGVAAAAVKAQPTLKWAWWTCVRLSVTTPRQFGPERATGKPVAAVAEGREGGPITLDLAK